MFEVIADKNTPFNVYVSAGNQTYPTPFNYDAIFKNLQSGF